MEKCIIQEQAYTKGWEERMDGHPYPDEPVSGHSQGDRP